jgi:hypothetical protein
MNTIQIDRLTQTNELATELASESARASASKSANEATARTSQNSLHKTPQNSSPKKLYLCQQHRSISNYSTRDDP